jgi:hypothetical protein
MAKRTIYARAAEWSKKNRPEEADLVKLPNGFTFDQLLQEYMIKAYATAWHQSRAAVLRELRASKVIP